MNEKSKGLGLKWRTGGGGWEGEYSKLQEQQLSILLHQFILIEEISHFLYSHFRFSHNSAFK